MWMSVDPLAEKYPGWSPYNYVMGNPLKYTDPNGDTVNVDPDLLTPIVDNYGKAKSRDEMNDEEKHKADFQKWWEKHKGDIEGYFGIGGKYETTNINFKLGTMPYPTPSFSNLFNLFKTSPVLYNAYDALTTFGSHGMFAGDFDRGGSASGPLNIPTSSLVFNIWFNPNSHKVKQNAAAHEWKHVKIIFNAVKNNKKVPSGADQHLLMSTGKIPTIK